MGRQKLLLMASPQAVASRYHHNRGPLQWGRVRAGAAKDPPDSKLVHLLPMDLIWASLLQESCFPVLTNENSGNHLRPCQTPYSALLTLTSIGSPGFQAKVFRNPTWRHLEGTLACKAYMLLPFPHSAELQLDCALDKNRLSWPPSRG